MSDDDVKSVISQLSSEIRELSKFVQSGVSELQTQSKSHEKNIETLWVNMSDMKDTVHQREKEMLEVKHKTMDNDKLSQANLRFCESLKKTIKEDETRIDSIEKSLSILNSRGKDAKMYIAAIFAVAAFAWQIYDKFKG